MNYSPAAWPSNKPCSLAKAVHIKHLLQRLAPKGMRSPNSAGVSIQTNNSKDSKR